MDFFEESNEIMSEESSKSGHKWEKWKTEKVKSESQKKMSDKAARLKEFVTAEGRPDVGILKSKFEEAQASLPSDPDSKAARLQEFIAAEGRSDLGSLKNKLEEAKKSFIVTPESKAARLREFVAAEGRSDLGSLKNKFEEAKTSATDNSERKAARLKEFIAAEGRSDVGSLKSKFEEATASTAANPESKAARLQEFVAAEGRSDLGSLKSKFDVQKSVPETPEIYYSRKVEESKDILQRIKFEGIGLHNYINQENLDLSTQVGKKKLLQAWVQSKEQTGTITIEDGMQFLEEMKLHRNSSFVQKTKLNQTASPQSVSSTGRPRGLTDESEEEWTRWTSAVEEAVLNSKKLQGQNAAEEKLTKSQEELSEQERANENCFQIQETWHCPAGHVLELPNDGSKFDCDICGQSDLSSTPGCLHCLECDFDVCESCKAKGALTKVKDKKKKLTKKRKAPASNIALSGGLDVLLDDESEVAGANIMDPQRKDANNQNTNALQTEKDITATSNEELQAPSASNISASKRLEMFLEKEGHGNCSAQDHQNDSTKSSVNCEQNIEQTSSATESLGITVPQYAENKLHSIEDSPQPEQVSLAEGKPEEHSPPSTEVSKKMKDKDNVQENVEAAPSISETTDDVTTIRNDSLVKEMAKRYDSPPKTRIPSPAPQRKEKSSRKKGHLRACSTPILPNINGIGLHNYICQENLDLTTRCGKQKLMQAWVQSKAATSQEVVTVEDAIGFLEEIRLHRVDASSLDTATHSTTNGVTPGKIPQEKIEFFTKLQEQEWNEWASAAEEAIGRGRISRRNRSPENTSVWKIVEDPIPEPEPHARQSTNEREPTKLPFNQSNLKSASERVTSPSIAPFKPVKLKKQHVRSRSTESFPPPQRPIMYQEALGATSIDEEPEIIEDKNLVRDLIKLFDKDNEQRNPECNVECNACSVS